MSKVALFNVPWDNTYKDNIYFDDRASRDAYFDKVYNVKNTLDNAPDVNFKQNTYYRASIVYRNAQLNAQQVLNANYCVVSHLGERYYYFITDQYVDTANQCNITLELDVIMSVLNIMPHDAVNEPIIERCHLNRWVNYGLLKRFDFLANSDLFEHEVIAPNNKRLVNRQKIVFRTMINSSDNYLEVNKWLAENVKAWLYFYLTPTSASGTQYKFWRLDQSSKFDTELFYFGGAGEQRPYEVICVPLMKTSKHFYFTDGTKKIQLDDTFGVVEFFRENNISNLLSVKISAYPPIGDFDNASIDADGSLNILCTRPTGQDESTKYFNVDIFPLPYKQRNITRVYATDNRDLPLGILQIYKNKENISSIAYDNIVPDIFKGFTNEQIVSRWQECCPKLYEKSYRSLEITNDIDHFSYDYRYINTSFGLYFDYNEALSPGVTRYYLRVSNANLDNDNILVKDTSKNLTGLVGSVDNTIPFNVNQFEQFLANNKNYYLQRGIGYAQRVGQMAMGVGFSSAVAPRSAVSGVVGGVGSLMTQQLTDNLNDDNMRSAPELVQNMNGDAFQLNNINDCALYIELYEALINEYKTAFEYYNRYGYSVNHVANLFNNMKLRKRHNYIKIVPGTLIIKANINDIVRRKIYDILERGISLWRSTATNIFDYNGDNSENEI